MRPEIELLLSCAAPVAEHERIRHLASPPLDWDYLESLAALNRLSSLLYWRLKSAAPEHVSESLEATFRRNLQNSLMLTDQLLRVLDLFESEGIAAIPFKGPTLANAAYRNLSLRSFDDLDILLHPGDVWRARDLLLRSNYTAKLQLNPAREKALLNSYDEFLIRGPGGQPLIELHWAFVPPHFYVEPDLAGFWKRASPVLLGRRSVPGLGVDDLYWVLALHGAKHCWSHLGLITDISWLLAQQTIDWDSIAARAEKAGALRMMRLPVLLASRVFRTAPPDSTAYRIDDPALTPLADDICAAWFGKGHDERAILPTAALHMRMRERVRDRMAYASRLLFRPSIEDWQAIDLPQSLSFLYPVLRFPRLILKQRTRVP